jgi:hypothetical protein
VVTLCGACDETLTRRVIDAAWLCRAGHPDWLADLRQQLEECRADYLIASRGQPRPAAEKRLDDLANYAQAALWLTAQMVTLTGRAGLDYDFAGRSSGGLVLMLDQLARQARDLGTEPCEAHQPADKEM